MSIAGLSTHQKLLSGAVQDFGRRVSETAGATEIEVTFEAGVQAGACRRLSVERMMIGSGPASDVILLEAQAAEEAVLVEVQRSVVGLLVDITAQAPGLDINGVAVPVGQRQEALRLPLTLGIGDSRLHLSRPADTLDLRKVAAPQIDDARQFFARYDPVLVVSALGLVALLAGTLGWNLMTDHAEPIALVGNTVETESPFELVVARDWPVELRDQVALLDLDDVLVVEQSSDGLIQVSGNVPQAKLKTLLNLQIWYDGQAGAPTVIWDIYRKSALETLPNIVAVRKSDPPGVFLESGAIVSVGGELIDDWVLSEIGTGSMTLQRGPEEVVVEFAEFAQ